MIPADRSRFVECLKNTRLESAQAEILKLLDKKYANPKHGKFLDWQNIIESLPKITASRIDLHQDVPVIGSSNDCTQEIKNTFKKKLKSLNPWRKGPFNLFGIHIDSEWRSDMKWSRIAPHIQLKNKLVLDIGASNGYYALRMQAIGAKLVIGAEPTWLYVFQFLAIQKYIPEQCVFILPFAFEELRNLLKGFDTVFSMGVLYHRQEPKEHLDRIYAILEEGGELVLETLIIEDKHADVLIPNGRYANMRNVWMIPSYPLLEYWLHESGFEDIELIDKTKTTTQEQRQTEWSTGHSLANALNSENPNVTIEGYPAPIRTVVKAKK